MLELYFRNNKAGIPGRKLRPMPGSSRAKEADLVTRGAVAAAGILVQEAMAARSVAAVTDLVSSSEAAAVIMEGKKRTTGRIIVVAAPSRRRRRKAAARTEDGKSGAGARRSADGDREREKETIYRWLHSRWDGRPTGKNTDLWNWQSSNHLIAT